jgi:hypothetical protein
MGMAQVMSPSYPANPSRVAEVPRTTRCRRMLAPDTREKCGGWFVIAAGELDLSGALALG